MLAFQHQDEITARRFFCCCCYFPKSFRIYQLSRPKIISKQESSDFNFSTDPCAAQLILFPNVQGRISLLSYPWRQMDLQTQNDMRITVTRRRLRMAPINTRFCPHSTSFTQLYSAGSPGPGLRASSNPSRRRHSHHHTELGIISGQQQKPALPPFVNKVLLETCQAHSFTLHC